MIRNPFPWSAPAIAVCLSLVVVGCKGSSSSGAPAEPPTTRTEGIPAFAVTVRADRTSGAIGTTFRLSAAAVGNGLSGERVTWDLGDGRSATGASTSVSYAAPGFYAVTARVVSAAGEEEIGGTVLSVFAPKSVVAPGGAPMPEVIGDVDGDGAATLADAHQILAHVRGQTRFTTDAQFFAGDVDFDRDIDQDDALLLGVAVAGGDAVPTTLSPGRGAPGTVVRWMTPALLDPDAVITVKVGQSAPFEPYRPWLGLASFVIPLDVQGQSPGRGTPGDVMVSLQKDGQTIESQTFAIETAPAGGDPVADVTKAMQRMRSELSIATGPLSVVFDAIGATAEERGVLQAFLSFGLEQLERAEQQLRLTMPRLNASALQGMGIALNANGLQDVLRDLDTLAATESVGDVVLTISCRFHQLAAMLTKIDRAVEGACAAIGLAALVPGPQQPFLVGVGFACSGLTLGSALTDFFKDFIPEAGDRLVIRKSRSRVKKGETADLEVQIQMSIREHICGRALARIEDKLKEKLTAVMLRKVVPGAAKKVIDLYKNKIAIDGKFRQNLVKFIKDRVTKIINAGFEFLRVNQLLGAISKKLCSFLPGGRTMLTLDPNGVLSGPLPASAGTLTLPGLGVGAPAVFLCDPASASSGGEIQFEASRQVCGKKLTGRTTIECGDAGELEICMGDNGSLNDDIFEVVLDGKSFLTSSQPVRRVCRSAEVTRGLHEVKMIGRAAPDGIGTYFIEFRGATVKSGPPLRGTNLAAGRVFTWTIEVR